MRSFTAPEITDNTANCDVIIIGAGPGGSSCAAFCAAAGMRTLLLDRARFPRDKVCGDCVNPSCFPVLDRLGILADLEKLVHAKLSEVDFIPFRERPVSIGIREAGEISIKRSLLDEALLRNAVAKGAEVLQQTTVTAIASGWSVSTDRGVFPARFVVGADGRNSIVARMAGLQRKNGKVDRVALQTHLKLPANMRERVALRIFPTGYAGYADVGGGELNLCLVGRSRDLESLKAEAGRIFSISEACRWCSVTPISRSAAKAAGDGVFLVGDAAKVVEPFTGEGIYYALRSGELAAEALIRAFRGELSVVAAGEHYTAEHRRMYRARLWVNQLAKMAVVHPRIGNTLIGIGRMRPGVLRYLTSKIVGRT